MTALKKLAHAYAHRDEAALEWKAGGGKVAGCLGPDIPEELLVAACVLPVRISGDEGAGTELADRYLEKGFDPYVRARFERIVGGTYRYLDRLLISNSSDAIIRVYYYLRAMREAEPHMPVPDLYFYDFLHTRFRMSAMYNRARTRDLIVDLESWIGKPITRDELTAAIGICNENRNLLCQVAGLRTSDRPRISGVQALQIIGASLFLPVREHSALIRELLAESKDFRPLDGVRLFVTGSDQDQLWFYELVESCGGLIVGEDLDMGNRHFETLTDPNADPIDAIVDRYQFRPISASQGTVSERTAVLKENVRKTRAEAVVYFIHQADDAPSWDFPEQRKELESMGVPVLLLDRQPYRLQETGELRRKIEAFLASVEKQASAGEGIR